MNRLIPMLFSSFLVCLTLTLFAQVDLPYYSGFDNTSERAGWQIYRRGESALANWGTPSVGGFSPSSCISHDYAPSSGAVLCDDWYVSPGFLIPAGGSLDSVRYFFSGFSVPADDDTIGIFLLTGSQNPANASSITLLADFRGDTYQADATYRLLPAITLPPSQETAYIGIRYLNAQVSSRWLTVRFDNVAVSGITTSVQPNENPLISTLYPNPCSDVITVEHTASEGMVVLHDQSGRVLDCTEIVTGQTQTTVSMQSQPCGLYFATIEQGGRKYSRAVVKNDK
jgi:hypothetical protein